MVNNGHTVQVYVNNGSKVTIDGVVYTLKQFHFHTPSEHTKSGYHAPMEVHFVHKTDDGKIAVIGVFIERSETNYTMQKIFKIAPEAPEAPATQTTATSTESINPSRLLPDGLGYYGYHGSLTTPPCSEGLLWHVMREPISASNEQITKFVSLIHEGHNARPTQPLNARSVTKTGSYEGTGEYGSYYGSDD